MAEPVLHLPAREVPVPSSISPEAQAVLASRPPTAPPGRPALEDLEGWHRQIREHRERMLEMIGSHADSPAFKVETLEIGSFKIYEVVPDGVSDESRPTILEIHGGGFINLGGDLCRILALHPATVFNARVWAVDYRQPPDHPFPTPLDDCLDAYRSLLAVRQAQEILVLGGSAGGNLAAAMVLRARDEGLPMPAGVILRTPAADLTDSGDSLHTNEGLDNVLFAAEPVVNRLYAGAADLRDPCVSPLFGDFTRGFPPTLLTSGTRDLFLSNTVRMHRALRNAGISADLHVMEAAGHGGFYGAAPEDREIESEMRAFADRQWSRQAASAET